MLTGHDFNFQNPGFHLVQDQAAVCPALSANWHCNKLISDLL